MPKQDDLAAVIAVVGDQLPQAPSMALRPKSGQFPWEVLDRDPWVDVGTLPVNQFIERVQRYKRPAGPVPRQAGGGIRYNDCSGLGNRAARRSGAVVPVHAK